MKKLKLDVEVLLVESFDAAPAAARVGTVAARDLQQDYGSYDCRGGSYDCWGGDAVNTVGTCIGPTYCCAVSWKPTCDTCVGTCGNSCGGSCDFTCRPGDVCPT